MEAKTSLPSPAAALVRRPLPFDPRADPAESRDLAAEHPARVARMEAALRAWCAGVESDRRGAGGGGPE